MDADGQCVRQLCSIRPALCSVVYCGHSDLSCQLSLPAASSLFAGCCVSPTIWQRDANSRFGRVGEGADWQVTFLASPKAWVGCGVQ